MRFGKVILVDELLGTPTDPARPAIYDRDIGMRLLYQDTGAEHYLIRYPAGLRAKLHRHSVAQTIVVLDGRLTVNGRSVSAGAFCHFPAGEPMHHAPESGGSCTFVSIFDGPADVEPLDEPRW